MFTLLSDLLTELFASRPADVEPNSKPLPMTEYQSKLEIAFSRLCKSQITAGVHKVATSKYAADATPVRIDSHLDFSL